MKRMWVKMMYVNRDGDLFIEAREKEMIHQDRFAKIMLADQSYVIGTVIKQTKSGVVLKNWSLSSRSM